MIDFSAGKYSPTQLLNACKISPFRFHDLKTSVAQLILAAVAVGKQGEEGKLIERIEEILENHCNVSIGASLEKLNSVASIPDEFDGGCDGLDALCYHLGGHDVEQAIISCQKIMARFKSDQEQIDLQRNGPRAKVGYRS
jgi:hypothetical protein